MIALLLAAAVPVEQAERAFAATAQRDGQWTAFRAFAAPDAVMFVPDKANAQAWLAGRADPPAPVMWWPARIVASCDGSLAVSTGPWLRKGGQAHGTFTTVWRRQVDGGWKWLFDHGRETPRAISAGETAVIAAPTCGKDEAGAGPLPEGVHLPGALVDPARVIAAFGADDVLVQRDGAMPARDGAGLPRVRIGQPIAQGCADDRSLCWESAAIADAAPGAHDLIVYQRRAGQWAVKLYDLVGVPAP